MKLTMPRVLLLIALIGGAVALSVFTTDESMKQTFRDLLLIAIGAGTGAAIRPNGAARALALPLALALMFAAAGCQTTDSNAGRSGWGDTRGVMDIQIGIENELPAQPVQDLDGVQSQEMAATASELDAQIELARAALETARAADDAERVDTLTKQLAGLLAARVAVQRPDSQVFVMTGNITVTVTTTGTTETQAAGDTNTKQSPAQDISPTATVPVP